MYITAFFTNQGAPATGLTPTIRIRDVSDNSLVVTDASMSEVGDGNYKYDFTTYDLHKDYAIRCDGGLILPTNERYTFGGNENYIEDIENSTLSDQLLGISAQIGDIKLSLEPVGFLSVSGAILIGTDISGDHSSTHTANDIYWVIGEDVGIDVTMRYNLFDDYIPQSIFLQAHFDANPNSWIDTYAWNFASLFWEKINSDSNRISSRSTDGDYQYYLTLNHFNPSGGAIRIRFESGSTKNGDVFYLDYATVIGNKILNPAIDYELMAQLAAYEVWDEETKSHRVSGSFGQLVQNTDATTKVISAGIVVLGTTTLAISAGVKENSDDLKRVLGLVHENIFIDNPVYDSDGNMTSGRLRIYSNPASVGTASDVIGTYQITAPSTAPGEFTSWKQIRTS